MESILNGLQSSAIGDRAAAIEKLSRRLAQGKPLNEKPDNVVKLISHTVSNLRDSNSKIVLQSLDVVEMFMNLHSGSFSTLINLCFELLMAKYSDGKASIRNKATEVMVELIGMTDLAAGYDRLYQQIQHSGKSIRVKEQIIYTLLLLHSTYGEEVLQIPDLLRKLGSLLGDSTGSVRSLAVDALATLHAYIGDRMLLELETQGVRTDKLVAIQDAVISESYLGAMEPVREVALSLLEKRRSSAQEAEYNGSKYSGSSSPDATVFSVESFGSGEAVVDGRPSSASTRRGAAGRERARSDNTSGARDYEGASEDKQSSRPLLRRAKTAGSVAPKKTFSATMGAQSANSSPGPSPSSTISAKYCQYDPRNYLELLRDGSWAQPVRLYSEKDLHRETAKALELCGHTADWQERMRGLSILQGLALGDALEYERDFVSILKKNHDTLIAQVVDLRSVLSKEGCRTVGILSRRLGPSFHPLVDVLVPPLLKLLLLKIKIMSGAADRAMRVIISTSSAGYPRMLPHLLEQSASKNAVVRRSCFEYLSMCCALWRPDVLDKHLGALCKAIKPGTSDADAGVRRAARHTFWVMEQRAPFHGTMLEFMESLEVSAQRHLQKELQDSVEGGGDGDLEFLFEISQRTLPPFSPDIGATLAAMDEAAGGQEGGAEREGNENLQVPSDKPATRGAGSTFPPRDGVSSRADAGADAEEQEPYVISERQTHASASARTSKRPASPESSGSTSALERGVQRMDLGAPSSGGSGSGSGSGGAKFSVVGVEREVGGGDGATVATSASAPGALGGSSAQTAQSGPASALTALKAKSAGRPRLGGATRVPITAPNGDKGDKGGAQRTLGRPQRVPVPAPAAAKAQAQAQRQGPTRLSEQGRRTEKPAVSEAEVAAAFCPSLDELRRMSHEEAWAQRLEALVAMGTRLKASVASPSSSPSSPVVPSEAALSQGLLNAYVDLSLERLPDVHQRVSVEALSVLQLCIEGHAGTPAMKAKLGPVLVALFHRLGDKRLPIRERANTLLNSVRLEFAPVAVVAALSPRIQDLPERTKTAVMQFLCVTVPHCGAYFQEGKHTWAFLGRMAGVMGAAGTKPSPSLLTAGTRLLELVYKAAPGGTLLQLSLLPLGQQELLKRLLETIEPNIDAMVSAAGREAGSWAPPLPGPAPAVSSPASASAPVPVPGEDIVAAPPSTDIASSSSSSKQEQDYDDEEFEEGPEEEREQEQEPEPESIIQVQGSGPFPFPAPTTASLSSPISSPRATSGFAAPPFFEEAAAPPSAAMGTEGPASAGGRSPAAQMRASPVTVPPPSGVGSVPSPPPTRHRPRTPPAPAPVSAPAPAPAPAPSKAAGDASRAATGNVDIAWLLGALSPSAPRNDQQEAVRVIRRVARTSHDKDHGADSWWAANCAQIVSVLLEALSPHAAGAVGDTNVYGADAVADETEAGAAVENMHTACKVLLLLVKYRAQVMLNLCELLATRLCQSAAFAPISVTLHCEQILMDLSKLDGRRMLKLVLPFSREAPPGTQAQPTAVKLLALHVIAGTLRSVPSSVLLTELPGLVEASLPSLSSDVVDLRKAVIFVLVEAYMVVGDALYPFVQELAPPQKKLLTIYCHRAQSERSVAP